MKKLIISVFLSLLVNFAVSAEDFVSGAIYVKSCTDTNTEFSWVDLGIPPKTSVLKIGRTYSSEKDVFELTTKDNQEVSLKLSSGLSVLVSPNSEFRVDAFNQMVSDIKVEPETLKKGDIIATLSLLNGSAYFIAPQYSSTNSVCVLQTPLVNIELKNGKYHIKASSRYTFVYVLEGTVGIYDNQNNKKSIKESGIAIVVFPNPMKNSETMITEKTIKEEELQKMSDAVKQLDVSYPDVIFAVIDEKIIGIKK